MALSLPLLNILEDDVLFIEKLFLINEIKRYNSIYISLNFLERHSPNLVSDLGLLRFRTSNVSADGEISVVEIEIMLIIRI